MQLGVSNDWVLLSDPWFDEQLDLLEIEVTRRRDKDPQQFMKSNAAKRLRMIYLLTNDIVPIDPSAIQYRLGKTLRSEYRHWRRAKFLQQFRLFFRYNSESKILLYSWFNDEESLRAYGSKTDAYEIFQKMLDRGNPPNTWVDLLDSIKQ
ncbi:MAG: hypothetical protein RL101_391 [Actinomycetota bacterium]|jgi:toxin YhaV